MDTEERLAKLERRVDELSEIVVMRNRAGSAEAPAPDPAPKGHTGSGEGWSVQSSRLIQNDDKA